ncbi:hypothetical protein PaeBR_18665 [Paenibacillus sp. BR2-3]|uniref:hypothetical protein n=1 Tax=Paenibacillus sp. BR2-3 TaxID=3048494 RepID=UPI0039777CD2
MASSAYDQSIRNSLVSKGIDNSKIGYSNGYVTVDGTNFQKADKNYNGTAFTNANNFNNAWNVYSQGLNKAPAPAVAPSGMVGVRSSLQSSGYDPNSIGYNNGMVTVNNQPFVTPSANAGGSAYVSPSTYNSALGNFRIGDLTNQVVNNTKLPDNSYTPQIDQLMKQLQDFSENQQAVDPYSTPEYAAYQAQADRRASQGVRAAQESLGSAGFGRSTALGERSQSIQNDQTEYLETQVIPQIIAANQAKRQQDYGNLMSLLSPLMSQQGYADNRAQTELGNVINALGAVTSEQQRGLDNSRADAALTGNYLTPDQRSAIDTLLALKQQAESPTATRQQRSAISDRADTVRSQLQALGIDPTAFGANVSSAQAEQAGVGRTLQGQQLDQQTQNQTFNQGMATRQQDFAEGQQAWENNYSDAQFKLNKQIQTGQLSIQQANALMSQAESLGYVTPQLAEATGLTEGAQFLNSQQFDLQKDNAAWDQEKAIADAQAKAAQNLTPQEYAKSYVNPIVQRDDDNNITNKNEVIATISNGQYSDAEMDKLFRQYGITDADVEVYRKTYSGN